MRIHDAPSPGALLTAAMSGDSKAFSLFCVSYLPKVQTWIGKLCADHNIDQSNVDDLCNQTILQVLQFVEKSRTRAQAVERPEPWLYRICRNVTYDYLRGEQRRRIEHGLPRDIEDVTAAPGELTEIRDLLRCLSPRVRQVLEHIYIRRFSIKDTALQLGISTAATRKAHVRGLAKLKESMSLGDDSRD